WGLRLLLLRGAPLARPVEQNADLRPRYPALAALAPDVVRDAVLVQEADGLGPGKTEDAAQLRRVDVGRARRLGDRANPAGFLHRPRHPVVGDDQPFVIPWIVGVLLGADFVQLAGQLLPQRRAERPRVGPAGAHLDENGVVVRQLIEQPPLEFHITALSRREQRTRDAVHETAEVLGGRAQPIIVGRRTLIRRPARVPHEHSFRAVGLNSDLRRSLPFATISAPIVANSRPPPPSAAAWSAPRVQQVSDDAPEAPPQPETGPHAHPETGQPPRLVPPPARPVQPHMSSPASAGCSVASGEAVRYSGVAEPASATDHVHARSAG